MLQTSPTKARRLAWRVETLASGLVALLALFVSAYTVYINRLQMKAQTWPRIVGSDAEADLARGHIAAYLKNRGIAPAEIRAARLSVGGKAVTTWTEYRKRVAELQGIDWRQYQISTGEPFVGQVVAPGEQILVLRTDSVDSLAVVAQAAPETELAICYCSMLDDCWEYVDAAGRQSTRTVPRCEAYPTPFVGYDEQDLATGRAFIWSLRDAGPREEAGVDAAGGGGGADARPDR